MNLTDRINEDIKNAMKAKEKEKLSTLRAIKSALMLEASKETAGAEIPDDVGIKILQKLQKQRNESAALYKGQNRTEEAAAEEFEAEVIASYLPAALSEDEMAKNLDAIIAELGASGMADMGKVMGKASSSMPTADGKTLSAMVRSKLA